MSNRLVYPITVDVRQLPKAPAGHSTSSRGKFFVLSRFPFINLSEANFKATC